MMIFFMSMSCFRLPFAPVFQQEQLTNRFISPTVQVRTATEFWAVLCRRDFGLRSGLGVRFLGDAFAFLDIDACEEEAADDEENRDGKNSGAAAIGHVRNNSEKSGAENAREFRASAEKA